MLAMKELGCNLVRIHIAGVDPRIYNLADKMGMLLWVEVPSPHRSNLQKAVQTTGRIIEYACINWNTSFCYNMEFYNEDWGANDIATNQRHAAIHN